VRWCFAIAWALVTCNTNVHWPHTTPDFFDSNSAGKGTLHRDMIVSSHKDPTCLEHRCSTNILLPLSAPHFAAPLSAGCGRRPATWAAAPARPWRCPCAAAPPAAGACAARPRRRTLPRCAWAGPPRRARRARSAAHGGSKWSRIMFADSTVWHMCGISISDGRESLPSCTWQVAPERQLDTSRHRHYCATVCALHHVENWLLCRCRSSY